MLGRSIMVIVMMNGAVHAQSANPEAGEDLFEDYCFQCHGAEVKGDGPMAELLAIAPPDLTGLATRNNGTFPLEAAARQIDGRDPLLAHGGEMPLFGGVLDSDQSVPVRLPSGQTMFVGEPLANVLAYLQSIQAD